MMKNLLIIAVLAVLMMTGCNNDEKIKGNNVQEPQKSQQQESANDDLNKSFEERTKEARDFMNQGDSLGIESLDYISKEHFVSGATLEKRDNYYVMKLSFASSKLYDKEKIENAYNLAQENGEYTFEGYTFYKNNNVPMNFDLYDEEYATVLRQMIEDLKVDGILAEDSDFGGLVKFMITPNNSNKYCVTTIQFAGASGFMITEVEKELEVTLLPNDRLKININQHSDGNELNVLSVEEFYNKAVIGENVELDGYSDFEKLDLLNLGDSSDSFGAYQNAVEFTDEIIINYTIGGV